VSTSRCEICGCKCVADVLQMCCSCVAVVLQMCCGCVAAVLQLCCSCVAHVLHMCCTRVAHVLRMWHSWVALMLDMWCSCVWLERISMGCLRLVGSLKLYVSFAKEPYKRDVYSPKRPVILSSLLIVATPYLQMRNLRVQNATKNKMPTYAYKQPSPVRAGKISQKSACYSIYLLQ